MLVYCFDDNKRFAYTDIVKDGATVPANATTVEPLNRDGSAMYAPTWNGTAWVSMTQEEFQEKYEQQQIPEGTPTITESQKQKAQFMLELSKMKSTINANTKLTATLAKQLAQVSLKDKEGQ